MDSAEIYPHGLGSLEYLRVGIIYSHSGKASRLPALLGLASTPRLGVLFTPIKQWRSFGNTPTVTFSNANEARERKSRIRSFFPNRH